MTNQTYDVIIIGGRNAGSSLALRLAEHNLKILLVDRASFPSLPAVPSSPFIHPGTMRLLDELGIPEKEYTHPGGKIEHYIMEFVNYFQAAMPTKLMAQDRCYSFGIDRNKFDTVLWDRAANAPGVTARDCFAVTKVLKDAQGNVTGIVGKSQNEAEETFTADLVVGADGRFSFAAREFGAELLNEQTTNLTASYHAEWENVDPVSDEYPRAISVHYVVNKFAVLTIPIADRKYIVGTYMRSEDADFGAQGLEAAYEAAVQSVPALVERLKNATRVTNVVGVRKIASGYREASGAGWALVGDALHFKDPIDGQGIYDALMETKILAEAIVSWKHGGKTWAEAAAWYHEKVTAATKPMLEQTMMRVKQQMFTPLPEILVKTYMRWMMTDPEYQATFLRYASRAIDPADFNVKASLSPTIIFRGLARDLRQRFAS